MPHVVQLDLLLLVPDHEAPRIKAELLKLEPRSEYVMMVLELARARFQASTIARVAVALLGAAYLRLVRARWIVSDVVAASTPTAQILAQHRAIHRLRVACR